MKRIITFLFLTLAFNAFAQKQPYVPFRTNGITMVKDSALAAGQFLIPTYTSPSLGSWADRWGQSFGLNRSNNRLTVRGNNVWLDFPSFSEVQSLISSSSVIVDAVPTSGSNNAVSSGGTFTALSTKVNSGTLTAGRIPYNGTGNTLIDNTNLQWDNTNRRIVLGGLHQGLKFVNTGSGKTVEAGLLESGSMTFRIKNTTDNLTAMSVVIPRVGETARLGVGNIQPGEFPAESQLYVYGGVTGANIDMKGDPSVLDMANMDLEGADFSTSPNSLGFSYYGGTYNAGGTNLGYANNNSKMGIIRFDQANTAIIKSTHSGGIVTPIRFGINDIEIANISDKGWSYQSNLASVNTTNPRWLPDKAYVDTKQSTLTLTTTGTGAATLVNSVINIPTPPSVDLSGYQLLSQKAVANGYASLDGNGLVPNAQLNSNANNSVNTLVRRGAAGQIEVGAATFIGQLNLSASPVVSTGPYDILVRKISTGVVEKISSASFGTGTVTNFSKIDGFGIASSVSNPTTTPVHTISADSTVLRTVNNSLSLSQLQTKFNTKANLVGGNFFSGQQKVFGSVDIMSNFTGSAQLLSSLNYQLNIPISKNQGTVTLYQSNSDGTGTSVFSKITPNNSSVDNQVYQLPLNSGVLALQNEIPTNYVTTNTSQTGITGTKEWLSFNTFRSSIGVGTLGNVATYSSIGMSGGGSLGSYLFGSFGGNGFIAWLPTYDMTNTTVSSSSDLNTKFSSSVQGNSAMYISTTNPNTTFKYEKVDATNWVESTYYPVGKSPLLKNYTASGNGSSTTIVIPHGRVGVTSSSSAIPSARNAVSAGWSYYTIDATNITLYYSAAPVSGTNNLNYSILINP